MGSTWDDSHSSSRTTSGTTTGDCYRKSVPADLSGSLAELLVSACGPDSESTTAETMTGVANELLVTAGKRPATNWDTGSLKFEILSAYYILEDLRFDKFMDATLNAVQLLCRGYPGAKATLLDKVNNTLLSANMGYKPEARRRERGEKDLRPWHLGYGVGVEG